MVRDLREGDAVPMTRGKGFGDRHRPDHEIGIRGDEGQVELRFTKVVEGEERLDSGDAATCDDDAKGSDGSHAARLSTDVTPAIRRSPRSAASCSADAW